MLSDSLRSATRILREANENRVAMAGAAAFLQKPFDDVALLAAIKNALGETESAATTERRRRATD